MLEAEHPECLHSRFVRSTISASQRYLTADVRKQYEHRTDILDSIFTTMALANSDSWYCVTQRSICFVCERPLSTSDGHRFFGHLLPLDLLAESDSQDSIERRDSSTADQYRIPHYHDLGIVLHYFGFPRSHMSRIIKNKIFQRHGMK